ATAASDDRQRNLGANCPCQFSVKSVLRTVPIHGSEKDFSRPPFLGFLRPGKRVYPCVESTTEGADSKARFRLWASLCINRDYNALLSKDIREFRDELRILDCTCIHAHLVGAI